MEAKLKALKVPELKDILTRSGTQIGSKANKADLIAKILATPAALKAAGLDSGEELPKPDAPTGDEDLLAPPDEFDWEGGNDSKSVPAPVATVVPVVAPPDEAPTPAPAAVTEETSTPAADAESTPAAAPQSTEDIELERRRARAARFGIPLVEAPAAGSAKGGKGPRAKGKSTKPIADGSTKVADGGKTAEAGVGNKKTEGDKADKPKTVKIGAKEAAPNDDDAKLAARAARFGISSSTAGPKAAGATVDPAEEEKRKKREARFGTTEPSKKAKTNV